MYKSDYKSNSALLKKVQGLGLSEKEAKVYLDLLTREQPVGTSKIVRTTQLYGQNVYDALAGLEEKGLATHVVVGTRKRFAATSPSRLELLAEQKKKLASEVAHDLSLLVRANHFQDFEFYQGEDAFIAHELDELGSASSNEEWLIVGGSGDRFREIMEDQLGDYDTARERKKISIRYIGSEEQSEELRKIVSARPLFKARILKKFDRSIVNTLVRSGSLSLCTYSDPVLTYQVRNQEVAKSYRNFFEALWATSNDLSNVVPR